MPELGAIEHQSSFVLELDPTGGLVWADNIGGRWAAGLALLADGSFVVGGAGRGLRDYVTRFRK